MRRAALYFSISILTFLTGLVTSLVLDRPAASTMKAVRPHARSEGVYLLDMQSRPKSFAFDGFNIGGGSIMVMDEKTGRIYCIQAGDRFAPSDF